ncbi:MAG: integrin alpha [Micropruina sp.]
MSALFPRAARLTFAALLAAPLLVAAPATPAHAAVCDPDNHVIGDLNSDGVADLVMGVPEYNNGRGAVDLLLSNGTRSFITAAGLGQTASAAGDYFGSAVAVADLNMDGCDDLVIGAPGRNGNGAIYLAFGTAGGSLINATIENAPTVHGSFGASLLVLAPEVWNGSAWVRTHQQVVVGAPTADDAGQAEAGAIYVYHSMPGDSALTDMIRLSQNSAGVPGTSEDFDRFGTTLAGDGRTIVIGTPDEAVGAANGAGSVTFLSSTTANPFTFSGKAITQNTIGVPGTAEAGDNFGEALAMQASYVVIGAPGEDVGSDSNTGIVQKGLWNQTTRVYTPGGSLSQDSSGIPGSNEDGDYFGAALTIVNNLYDQTTVAIGAPGENVGAVLDAGSVTIVRINGTPARPAKTYTQNSTGIPGVAEAGDLFGAALTYLPGDLDDGEGMTDGLVIGTPGEDIGAIGDAGSVTYTRNLTNWYTLLLEDTGGPDIPSDTFFGGVLALPGAGG